MERPFDLQSLRAGRTTHAVVSSNSIWLFNFILEDNDMLLPPVIEDPAF
jgi:hypothetical protein